jgi:hypothetical protein
MARKLNEEGFTTAENKPFRMEQVRRIIQRESIYKGTYQYAGVQSKGKYEAII